MDHTGHLRQRTLPHDGSLSHMSSTLMILFSLSFFLLFHPPGLSHSLTFSQQGGLRLDRLNLELSFPTANYPRVSIPKGKFTRDRKLKALVSKTDTGSITSSVFHYSKHRQSPPRFKGDKYTPDILQLLKRRGPKI